MDHYTRIIYMKQLSYYSPMKKISAEMVKIVSKVSDLGSQKVHSLPLPIQYIQRGFYKQIFHM
jgi:hypothetical protein